MYQEQQAHNRLRVLAAREDGHGPRSIDTDNPTVTVQPGYLHKREVFDMFGKI